MISDEVTQWIWNSVPEEEKWMARKFIANLDEHKRRHPNFKEERVAEIFVLAPSKYRKWYCYRPIKEFTKSIQFANRMSSLARNERD